MKMGSRLIGIFEQLKYSGGITFICFSVIIGIILVSKFFLK